ncbi:hypothetical protein GU926_04925 [Nibribacter ruber]|uniref:Uncharacterized protein n=1 Tax=Nibribacter ruber TaxID=2698458 RepID=A0A6P1NY13_9BACT|nr:hypothetical protein [Nibribacter ruber]QHL86815.1 hypothetical protein GU926_04925 [Nibribacter ruber]
MKKMRHTWSLLAMSLALVFTACQKEEAPAPDSIEFASAEYQLPDLQDLETPEISIGSETAPFTCTPLENQREKLEALKKALQSLHLDQNQRTAIKGFVQQHHACIAQHLAALQNLHQNLLQRANAQREAYVKAYKAGEITKAQLEEKLTTLRATLKEQMAKHEVKERQMRLLRKCRQELLQKIESVLSQEQLQKWNTWKSRLG